MSFVGCLQEGSLVLYSFRIEMGRMRMPFTDEILGTPEYDSLISIAKSAMESPYVRKMRLLSREF